MKRYLPHLGIALGVAIAVYALFFSESDEDRIRDVLDRLTDAIAVTPEDQNMVLRAAHIKGEFADIFTKEVSFAIPELNQAAGGKRVELVGLAAKAPQLWSDARVDLSGLSIRVDEAGLSAVAVGDAQLDAIRRGGQIERDTRKVSISLDKIDGDWRIVSLTVSAKGGGS